jgi:protein TonB
MIAVALSFGPGCTHSTPDPKAPPRPSRLHTLTPHNELLDWAAKDETTPPRPVRSENPVYPIELRTQGVRGPVVVEITIGADGKVTRVHAVHSPHPMLSRVAVEAVQRWEFLPAKRQGRAIETTFQTRIDFEP